MAKITKTGWNSKVDQTVRVGESGTGDKTDGYNDRAWRKDLVDSLLHVDDKATAAEAEAGTDDVKYITSAKVKKAAEHGDFTTGDADNLGRWGAITLKVSAALNKLMDKFANYLPNTDSNRNTYSLPTKAESTGPYTLATTAEEAKIEAYTTTLTFDSIFGKFLDKHIQTGAENFTVAASGNKKGASISFDFVSDGVSAINFDNNFTFFYGVTPGEPLAAGTYEFFLLYKNGTITVNVPGGNGKTTTKLTASETTVSSGSAGQMTVSWS